MRVWKPPTAYSLDRETAWAPLMQEVDACMTVEAVRALWTAFLVDRHRHYPESWSLAFRDACERREDDLMAGDHHAEMDAAYRATVSP